MSEEDCSGTETRKKWRTVINGFFSTPAIIVFCSLMLQWLWVALGMLVVFIPLLLASGVRPIFHLLPRLTRYLILTAPLIFGVGWVIGHEKVGGALGVSLAVTYTVLQIISNLSIPPYLEDHTR